MVKRICQFKECGKKFWIVPSILLKKGGGKYCSSRCHYSDRKNHTSPKRGHKYPELSGKNSPVWKGDNAGYFAKHKWVESKKGLAKFHKCSKEDNTCKGLMNWSNISGKHLRKLSDWWILCQSHHTRFDMNDNWRKRIGIANSISQIGHKVSKKTREKISLARLELFRRINNQI